MTMLFGINSTAGMVGSAGVLAAIQAQMAATSAANGVAAAALRPPGNEGASARALASQHVNAAMFETNFALGLKEMMELIPTLTAASAATEATAVAGAARI